MIAYFFPPTNESGSARPFYFAKHLSEYGWRVTVLAPDERVRPETDHSLLDELVGRCKTIRVPVAGKGASGAASRASWLSEAPKGLSPRVWRGLCRACGVVPGGKWGLPALLGGYWHYLTAGYDVIWVTGPPFRGTLDVGYHLSRLTGRPLVADLRDPWTYGVLWRPANPRAAEHERRREARLLHRAARVTFTSPLTTRVMRSRVPAELAARMLTLPNGFREDGVPVGRKERGEKCVFRYIGRLSRKVRQPDSLLTALATVCADPELRRRLELQFVGQMDGYEQRVKDLGLEDCVRCLGQVSLQQSLELMRTADVLVLLQTIQGEGDDCISGKAFEYLAAGRPVLAVVPATGGDAWLIRHTNVGQVADFEDPAGIATVLREYWERWRDGTLEAQHQPRNCEEFGRRNLTCRLAAILDDVVTGRAATPEDTAWDAAEPPPRPLRKSLCL